MAFLSKVLLAAATFLGLLLLIIPGLLVFLAFGWVPLRVLLKGESLLDATKGSLRMMAVAWRRMLFTSSALALAYLLLAMLVGSVLGHFVPEPTLWQRLTHPLLWLANFVGTLLSLWLSACFLALFRRLDQPPISI